MVSDQEQHTDLDTHSLIPPNTHSPKHPFPHSQDTVTGLGMCLAPIPFMAEAVGSESLPMVTSTPGNRRAASTGEMQHNL